jgi:hypothetical protein
MNFQLVKMAGVGPIVVRCMGCMNRIEQSDEERHDYILGHKGRIWANLAAAPFTEYFCTPCKERAEKDEPAVVEEA